MYRVRLFILLACSLAASAAQASSPCSGGSCRVGQAVRGTAAATTTVVRGAVRTTAKVATAPARATRRFFGR